MYLSQLIFTLGHIGLNMIIYAEKLENNLKKMNTQKDDKKNKKQKEEEGNFKILIIFTKLIIIKITN